MYIDDIILAGTFLEQFTRIKGILENKFKTKDLGILKYFWRIEVAHSHKEI